MRFYIYTGSHFSPHGIADTVQLIKNALQDCGHSACVSHQLMAGHVNILIENFTAARSLQALAEAHALGARFILVGTEPIVDGSFNRGIVAQHHHYSDTAYWDLRYKLFLIAAELADAVWVLAESMVPTYRETLGGRPIQFLPHGYVEDFANVRQRPEPERDIDFYFSGSLTDHRRQILDTLSKDHYTVYYSDAPPEYMRQDHVSRAKVCLSLRLSPNNDIPSVSRMHYHLQNRSFLLHEAYELGSPLDPFVLKVPSEDLIEWARSALELGNRRSIAQSSHELFKAALPMSRLLPPLLDEALSAMRTGPERRHHLPSLPPSVQSAA